MQILRKLSLYTHIMAKLDKIITLNVNTEGTTLYTRYGQIKYISNLHPNIKEIVTLHTYYSQTGQKSSLSM